MAKDPAVLFYYQDFLVGTQFMTDDEVGKYIRMLCHQADKGSLSPKQVLSICKASAIPDFVNEKFLVDSNGSYYNKRMSDEKEKRSKFTESRRNNALNKKTYAQHMENEDENKNEIVIDDLNGDTKKSKSVQNGFIELFPENTDENLLIAWSQWIDYRREKKKSITESTAKKQINFLLTQPNPVECINRSIQNGWIGLFEVEENGKERSGASPEQLASIVARRFQKQQIT